MNKKKIDSADVRAGVWMDHHVAHIVSLGPDGKAVINSVEMSSDNPSHKDKEISEAKKHSREAARIKKFYTEVQKELTGFNHILLTGTTTAGAEFHHHLQKVRSFQGKRIAEERSPKMTKRQLVAYMQKKLGKPMNIFRPEEVV